MPKTYTDDVAPVLPSSITGPFQVVSAGDINSWIRIDPAAAKISAAGSSQPIRRIVTPGLRNYSSVTQSVIGANIAAVFVTPTTNGGLYFMPVQIPSDMDVSKPCKVKILVSPTASATTNGQVVRYQLSETHLASGGARTETSFHYDWSVPDNWTVNDNSVVTLDGVGGDSFAGGTFQLGQQLALRIARLGSATEDTFDKNVAMAEYAILEYTAAEL
jgi:hypothetical protein